MSLPVEFLSGAEGELQEVFNRLEDFREGFGTEFMTVVEADLARIAVFPEIAPVYLDRVRRQVIQKFPYGIFFRTSSDPDRRGRASGFAPGPACHSATLETLKSFP